MASTQKPLSQPRKPQPPAYRKVAPNGIEMPESPEGFKPVEFWNPVYPNEHIFVHVDGMTAEYAQDIHFLAGYFRATQQWQIDAITDACGGRVYTADTSNQIRCDKCGWATRSTAAFAYHIQQHA